ncbi:adenylate/guanylate cyclase domain-containing protein [Parachryseolinea silvisoli]|uniref:adenylate/guanylate cyclase domain-containing protein n=1 Tax=Parachryseolinea silvisoli TaxID=2873601 RepID=UPI002265B1CC|nr:adenylate/guanylate cyclase domain-containing protein [Parachryseolinea silvisoli]MCD9015480.1 adenylate/guanylate cyclase domain-containing protein [Parachryseolinea silvisoli]
MPNLTQVYYLKEKYHCLSESDKDVHSFLSQTGARDSIKKAINLQRMSPRVINEAKAFSLLESFNPSAPEIIRYFEEGKQEQVILLFIDITAFSTTIAGWSTEKIKVFLDDYYKDIIPLIYAHGGQIEKLMGDGIICVFGKPFLDVPYPNHVARAERCAESVIKKFRGTSQNVKVAIHEGPVAYYKVPGEHYQEYTMIGPTITQLYRLESVSQGDSINYFSWSSYDVITWIFNGFDPKNVAIETVTLPKLQGVDYNTMKVLKFLD